MAQKLQWPENETTALYWNRAEDQRREGGVALETKLRCFVTSHHSGGAWAVVLQRLGLEPRHIRPAG